MGRFMQRDANGCGDRARTLDRVKDFVFFFGLGVLFTHELDAMPNHEWRVLPLVRLLPEEMGMNVFVVAHVPLFAFLIALVASPNSRIRTVTKLVVSGFLVLHGFLHTLFASHPKYEFSSFLSDSLILGAAVPGGAYIALEIRSTYLSGT